MSSLAYHFATTDSWRRPLLSFREFWFGFFNFFWFWTFSTRDFFFSLIKFSTRFLLHSWASYLGREMNCTREPSKSPPKNSNILYSTFHSLFSNRFWGFDYIPPIFIYSLCSSSALWWTFLLSFFLYFGTRQIEFSILHLLDISWMHHHFNTTLGNFALTFLNFSAFASLFFIQLFFSSLRNFLFIFSSFSSSTFFTVIPCCL